MRARASHEEKIYTLRIPCQRSDMIELIRTNDPVVISFVESLLRDADIRYFLADQNMSVMEGSLGILPRRILVDEEQENQARRLLKDAGIAHETRAGSEDG